MQAHVPEPSPRVARRPLDAPSGRRGWAFAVLLLLCQSLLISQGFTEEPARDRAELASDVVVMRGSRGELVRLTGTVVEYAGEGLLLRPRVGPDRTVPAEQVLAVETKRQPGFLESQAEKAAGRIEKALALLRDAMNMESRPWARREIAAEIVRCSQAAGNEAAACELFLQLISEDPRTPYMDCIPLAWTPDQQSSALENAAKAWLHDSRPAAQLLGASHLLLGPTGAEAAARLRSLALGREGDSRIALLAAAQLWRTQAFTAPAEEIERWEQIAEKLPLPYRGGPYYVIASAWMHRRQADRAVTLYLKVGLLCDNPRPLVARCLWEAANALQKTDWKEDAARVESLRRELTLRFPETRWTRQQAPSEE
ncbi:MAG: hypothetical protein ACUVQK_03090 [Thermogutta sp.]